MSAACKRTAPERCSPRRPPATIERRARVACAFGIAVTLAAVSAAQTPHDERPSEAAASGAAALERFLAEVQTYEADFEQELWSADQRLLEEASGTLALQRPNRFRWNYERPMEQLLVTDGERLWMYDVELGQVTVAPLEDGASASPAMLLSGDEAVRESFNVVGDFSFDGLDWVRLEPTLPGTDFTAVLIGFRADALERLELIDGLEQVTRIEFSNAKVNLELDEELFEFEPPPGVDVLGARD